MNFNEAENAARNAFTPIRHVRFGSYDKIIAAGIEYIEKKGSTLGYELTQIANPAVTEFFSAEHLADLQERGELEVVRNFFLGQRTMRRELGDELTLSDLRDDKAEKALFRLSPVKAFLQAELEGEFARSDDSMKKFIDQWYPTFIKETFLQQTADGRCGTAASIPAPPSPTTLRKWIRRFEVDYDVMSLCDQYGKSGNSDPRISADARALMAEYVQQYMSNLKPTMAHLYREMTDEFARRNITRIAADQAPLKAPGRGAFERAIAQLEPYAVMAAREGAARARRHFYAVRSKPSASRPLERVEIDETKIPVQTFFEDNGIWPKLSSELQHEITHQRLWLSTAIDAYSRVILAARIVTAPSIDSALATLRMVLCDKTSIAQWAGCEDDWAFYGTPETVVTDSGSNFRSRNFQSAVLDIQADWMLAPAGLPQARARKERSYGTFNKQIFGQTPGFTFESVAAKGDYNPEPNMVLTIEELAQILIRYIVDVYHNRPHAGLGGASPRAVFEKGVRDYQLLLPPSNEELQHIFGAMVRRKVTNRGVRVLGLHYQSSELQRARRQPGFREVDVRIDENDLGAVSVRTKDGWMSVPCIIDMAGQDVDTWVEAQNSLRRNNAQVTAMSATTVQNATKDIAQFIEAKSKRSKISSPLFTSEKADQFERDIFKGFDIARDASHNLDILQEALGQDDGEAVQEFDLVGAPMDAEASNVESDTDGDEDEWTVE